MIKFLIYLFLILFSFYGCSGDDKNEQGVSKTAGEISIPSAIRGAALPSGATLIAEVYIDYVDDSSIPAETQNLTLPVTENVQFTLSGISLGDHRFTVIFKYTNDPEFPGTFELARGASEVVPIVDGTNPGITLDDAAYDTSADDDNDTVPNLTELDMRSNPGDDVCVIGVSKIGSCSLDT
jgi:hypothetical protein